MLYVVRHGRTAANASGLLLGRRDPPLDETGRAQAAAVAAAIGRPDRVIASPLARAQETAAAFGVAVETDDRWIELDYGDWDERPLRDIAAAEWAVWRADPSWEPPRGESLATLGVRVREACESLAAEAADRDVVVVSHVSPIKAAVAWALGVGDDIVWRMHLAPASITRIALRGGTPVLFSFNEVAHLPA